MAGSVRDPPGKFQGHEDIRVIKGFTNKTIQV